jgi:hypothetical protein
MVVRPAGFDCVVSGISAPTPRNWLWQWYVMRAGAILFAAGTRFVSPSARRPRKFRLMTTHHPGVGPGSSGAIEPVYFRRRPGTTGMGRWSSKPFLVRARCPAKAGKYLRPETHFAHRNDAEVQPASRPSLLFCFATARKTTLSVENRYLKIIEQVVACLTMAHHPPPP